MAFSAALYIHIPFCIQRCNYCDFFSTVAKNDYFKPYQDNRAFVARLLEDIFFLKDKYKIDLFSTAYIGGGTPSLLSPNDISYLVQNICDSQIEPILEFSIEANPEDIRQEFIDACLESGINRFSLGIQTFDDAVLKRAARRGSAAQSKEAIQLLKRSTSNAFSLDFIAGLHGQTPAMLAADIQKALLFEPPHISLYELCESDTFEHVSEAEQIRRADCFDAGVKLLKNAGFMRYEVSNFAREVKFESEHNKTYWHMRSYLGVGPGAVGSIIAPDHSSATRISASQNIAAWLSEKTREHVYHTEVLSKKTLIEETLLSGFRLFEGISIADFFSRFGFNIAEVLKNTCAQWQKKAHLLLNDSHIALNESGMQFLNQFLVEAFIELEKENII